MSCCKFIHSLYKVKYPKSIGPLAKHRTKALRACNIYCKFGSVLMSGIIVVHLRYKFGTSLPSRWPGGPVARWPGGLVAWWPGGLSRWPGGLVAWWPGGPVA